jgi:hypothetical protein
VEKVRKMCASIREHLPQAKIVIGGYVANIPDIEQRLDADYIVSGDGISWMRHFLGEEINQPIRHPPIVSVFSSRAMGIPLKETPGEVAAAVIPTLGCPKGCNFCTTSAMFGGKGHLIHFYEDGDTLYEVMCDIEKSLKARSFFLMDENFLFYRKRALRLLELMITNRKSWSLFLFSSADTLRSYTMEQLVALGVSWLWLGLEGKEAPYEKLHGTDTRQLVRELQAHGIRVLGSSIIGLENHNSHNIEEEIAHAVAHNTDFHQFMLYMAGPDTPLFAQLKTENALRSHTDLLEADQHGQYEFNFNHPSIPRGQETDYLLQAFQSDFLINGPSIVRMAQTILKGWQKYKNYPDPRIRDRYRWEARDLPVAYAAVLWASWKWLQGNPQVSKKTTGTLKEIYREFGFKSRLAAVLGGLYILFRMGLENRRLKNGWVFEPPTFYELNAAAKTLEASGWKQTGLR